MAKKKRPGSVKRAGGRRTVRRKRATTRRRTTRARAGTVDLRAIRRQLEVSVGRLQQMSTRGVSTDAVRGRLERMMADLDDLCDPNNSDGCHPTMVFPPEQEA